MMGGGEGHSAQHCSAQPSSSRGVGLWQGTLIIIGVGAHTYPSHPVGQPTGMNCYHYYLELSFPLFNFPKKVEFCQEAAKIQEK